MIKGLVRMSVPIADEIFLEILSTCLDQIECLILFYHEFRLSNI